jgi:purine-binding chemotaxis protein CheW
LRLGDLLFGVEVTEVQEVIRYQQLTRVPLASEMIRGLMNLRGQIVTAIDLRRRLGMPDLPEFDHPANVVVRSDESTVSLLVDEIGEVVEVDEAAFEPPPVTLHRPVRQLIRGAYKLQERLLLILDTEQAIDLDPSLSRC